MHFGGHPWAGVHVIQNGTPKFSLLDWDVFVDDKPETVESMLNGTSAQVFAPRRPWNEEPLACWAGVKGFTHYTYPSEILDWVEART